MISGSDDLTDPQSFKRYAYVRNDSVNFVDPSGLCVFNVNIVNNAGVSKEALQSMRLEISRIFRAAGHAVVFNMPRFPDINSDRSYTITIQRSGQTPGWTPVTRTGFVSNEGFISVDRLRESINSDPDMAQRALGMAAENFGRALGRVTAHEATHYFLQLREHAKQGLMRFGFGGRQWFSTANNNDFLLQPGELVERVGLRCPPISTTEMSLGTELSLIGGQNGDRNHFHPVRLLVPSQPPHGAQPRAPTPGRVGGTSTEQAELLERTTRRSSCCGEVILLEGDSR